MNHSERARRYLQASMNAGYTGLPDEHREAYEAQMRDHERAYPGVRKHALTGTDQDFDEALTAGEREHQRHLRREEGLTEKDVLDARKQLRGVSDAGTSGRARPRRASSRARRAVRYAGRETGASSAISDTGSLTLRGLGILGGLAIVYLLLNEQGEGPKAFAGLLNLVTGAVRVAVGPIDPLGKETMKLLGAGSESQQPTTQQQAETQALFSGAPSLSRPLTRAPGALPLRKSHPLFDGKPGLGRTLTRAPGVPGTPGPLQAPTPILIGG